MDHGEVDRKGSSSDGNIIMAGHSIFEDTFEKVVELGRSTLKTTVQAVKGSKKTNPKKTADESGMGIGQTRANIDPEMAKRIKTGKHTALDMKQLEEGYKNQDQKDIDEVRHKLEFFRKYKDEEKKAIEDRKRFHEERLQRIAMEEEEKKKHNASGLKSVEAPKGKERRSILSRKKVVKRNQMETRADSGKQ